MKTIVLSAALALCILILPATLSAQTTTKFIDPANMDLSIKPGDNFYLYANGNWLKNTPIPASKTRWGSFNILAYESSQALKGLLEDAAARPGNNSLMKRVGDYYAGAMDSMAIEKLGSQPIKPYLDAITALASKAQVLRVGCPVFRWTYYPWHRHNNRQHVSLNYCCRGWQQHLLINPLVPANSRKLKY